MLKQIVTLYIQMYIYIFEHDEQWAPEKQWTFLKRDKSPASAWIWTPESQGP
jgi:hypothetical protein